MGKNLAARMISEQDNFFNAGKETGEQFAADCFAIALKRCGVSKNKIIEATQLAMKIAKEYGTMFETKKNKEADVQQEHFDEPLKEIFCEKYVPWEERYENIKPCKY